MRLGSGYDSHRLVKGRKLVLGGVNIPFGKGLIGHSDADVLCHAIIDSVIGALGLGDIGEHFPDTDPAWKDASSVNLLKYIVGLVRANGYKVSWIDAIVIAERPKLSPFIESMKEAISPILKVILFESRYSRNGSAYFLEVLRMSLNSAIVISDFLLKKPLRFSNIFLYVEDVIYIESLILTRVPSFIMSFRISKRCFMSNFRDSDNSSLVGG